MFVPMSEAVTYVNNWPYAGGIAYKAIDVVKYVTCQTWHHAGLLTAEQQVHSHGYSRAAGPLVSCEKNLIMLFLFVALCSLCLCLYVWLYFFAYIL